MEMENLYKYVIENVGKKEFEFKKVSKDDFCKFLKNYPRHITRNMFMGWFDYYDFYNYNEKVETRKYKVARIYDEYGAEEHYLPMLKEKPNEK